MNETKRLSITMTRGERVLGWLYVPFFLVLLAWILAEGFRLLGWDTGTLLGQARLNGVFFGVNFLATVLIYRKFLSKSLAMVGPGQNFSASAYASGGTFSQYRSSHELSGTWMISGLSCGRPLARKMRSTASSFSASAPRP